MTDESQRVLLVDDNEPLLGAYAKSLQRAGFEAVPVSSAEAALALVRESAFDAIVTDVSMGAMSGLELLHAVRELDLEVPVILITGNPDVASAIRAVELGAFRYLLKPVEMKELERTVKRAVQMHRLAKLKQEAMHLMGLERGRIGDIGALETRFTMALRALYMVYQPIVSFAGQTVFGYEALLRSAEPSLGNPMALLEAAERLERGMELGRAVRAQVAKDSVNAPEGVRLFVNLHSRDLSDDELFDGASGLSALASRTVLEITERESLDGIGDIRARVKALRTMGFKIAVDDLGAGYSGLTSFSQLEPEIAKIDMSLVRGIDSDVRKQRIVRSMARLCEDLGALVVAEGVETKAERETLTSLGCDLLQGYLFSKPDKGFPSPRW